MTEISEEKQRILRVYAKKFCGLSSPLECTKKPCTCGIAAEYRAIKKKIIPEKFCNFTIRDFHGKISNNAKLNSEVAIRAKKQVFQYCWKDISLLDKLPLLSDIELDKYSVIADRIKNGQSVIIHGEPKRLVNRSSDQKTNSVTELPLGRTFIASIITNEAIKLRLNTGTRSLSYEWIDFSSFLQTLSSREYINEEKMYYESCDWLVIDDISSSLLGASSAQQSFAHQVLDSFFARRTREKRPTVLVFKFDLNARRMDVEQSFGVAIGRMITDTNTFIIDLNESVVKE